MININKGRYWDFGIKLVEGCTPCSPGCDNCWSLSMEKRFGKGDKRIKVHPGYFDRLSKRKKPAVYAIWNDLFHEDVPTDFIGETFFEMNLNYQHTYLILTKRAERMAEMTNLVPGRIERAKIWYGLTICNQQEADEKIPIFLKVPGKKFLSIEPCLEEIDIVRYLPEPPDEIPFRLDYLHAIILGGETGPKARPMHPDWVRSIRDQCQAAGVPFFFKQWGEWRARDTYGQNCYPRAKHGNFFDDNLLYLRVGKKAAGRTLDGRTHDDLPWLKDYKPTGE